MITLYKENGGKCTLEWRKKVASTAFAFNDAVSIDSNGFLKKLAAGEKFYGLCHRAVASTDDDYASNTRIPVLVCGQEAEYIFDVSTGSAAQTDVGEECDFEDHDSIDVTASTNDDVLVTDIISATKVIGKVINKASNK